MTSSLARSIGHVRPDETADRADGLPPAWRDPLTWVFCVIALAVYLPRGFEGYLSRDLALYSYGGQQFADGVAPYVAVVNRAGPLAHAVPGLGALAARAIGMDDVTGMRVLFMLISMASVAAAYRMGRTVFRSRLAGIGTAAVLLGNQGFVFYATNGPREKTTLVLFVVLSMTAMARRRWATVGVFIALATLTWQPVFFSSVAGAAVAVLYGERSGRIRALLRVAVGGLVPTALIVAAYAAIGHLKIFFDDFLLINARYTKQVSLAKDPGDVVKLMRDGYGPSLFLFVAGLLALIALAVAVLIRRASRDDRGAVMLVASFASLIVGILFALKAMNGFPDVFFLIPPAGLGIGGVVGLLRAHARPFAIGATALVCAAAIALGLTYSIGHSDDQLEQQRHDVAAVMSLLPSDATILSLEAPQPLVLTGKRNLTRYQLFGNGLIDYLDATWPGGRAGYARDVLARRPTVIALGGLDDPAWMTDPMKASYVHIGHSPGWGWYVRKDLGAPTLQKLERALDD